MLKVRFLFLLGLLGCGSSTETTIVDSIDVQVAKDTLESVKYSYNCDQLFLRMDKYDILPSSLSPINEIKDIDSLFNLADLNKDICDTSLSFERIKNINQILINEHLDGYVGEFMAGIVFNQFENCPCLFYGAMNHYYHNDTDLYGSYRSCLFFNMSMELALDSSVKILDKNRQFDISGDVTKDLIKGITEY